MRSNNTSFISLELPRALLFFVSLGVTAWYLTWRLGTFNPDAPIFSTLLYGAELFGLATVLMHGFMTWRLSVRQSQTPEEGKSVDVFITTLNEDASIIRRTALTALSMDYQHNTWILDDGNRKEIRALAENLGCGYISREVNTHAKAGNLNHALSLTSGEFIAIFDADHAPKKSFLARTLGYFRDAEVAFVQTPQDFYNLDSYQHRTNEKLKRVWTEQSLFFRIIQRGKDVWNAAFFCGSCAVIRRSALEAIGGFATDTVTEDLHTSVRLHKAGFKSVYHDESLAFGIAASQVKPFLSQRIRWGKGAMQVWRMEGIVFSRNLTLAQKICYMASILTYFDGWQKFIYYITPAMVLMTGLIPVNTTMNDFLLHFVPYFVLSLWSFEELGRGYGRTLIIEQYNMARFGAFCSATLGLVFPASRFRVTSKHMTATSGMWRWLVPQYGVLILNAAAIVAGALLYMNIRHISFFSLTANILWSMINLLMAGFILAFSQKRAAFQRSDYRFSIPLTARMQQPEGELLVALQDISSSGITVIIPGIHLLQRGDDIKGEIFLPDGFLPFRATVCNASRQKLPQQMTRIGCKFSWERDQDRNRLERFLHGSDLEWQLHHLSERSPTLLERLLPKQMRNDGKDELKEAKRRAQLDASILYYPSEQDHRAQPAMMINANGKSGKNIVSFLPIPLGSDIESRVFSNGEWQTVRGRIASEHVIRDRDAIVYQYELEGQAHEAIIHHLPGAAGSEPVARF